MKIRFELKDVKKFYYKKGTVPPTKEDASRHLDPAARGAAENASRHLDGLAQVTGKIRFFSKLSQCISKKGGNSKRSPFAVLDGLNLKIYENKINAIVGKSGCGKSTLTRLLMRMEDYTSGEILYQGGRIESVPIKEFRKKNQVMFQNPLLSVNPYFKIKAIICEPLIIDGRDKKDIREKVSHLLDVLGIPDDILGRYPGELSAGQLQRVVFARALVLDPEFIVLDEPFSSLDEIMAKRLMKHFKKVFTRLNMGVLYISHHLERVQFFADTAALMEKGKITRYGTAENFYIK